LSLDWNAKRMLTKINYKIHTDAIKESIVLPLALSNQEANITYANEADVLNKALFNLTIDYFLLKLYNEKLIIL